MPLLWTVWHIIAMSSNVDWCMIYVKTRSTGTCSSSSRGCYSCSELLSIQSRAQFCVSLVNSNVIVHTTTHVFILCSSCKLLSSILCHCWLLLVLSIDKAECCRCDCWPKWQALRCCWQMRTWVVHKTVKQHCVWFSLGLATLGCVCSCSILGGMPWQVVHTHLPLMLCSMIWYQPNWCSVSGK